MKSTTIFILALCLTCLSQASDYKTLTKDFVIGKADVQSMSVLTFGPEGILLLGDSKSGHLFALDLDDRDKNDSSEGIQIEKIDVKIASMLGVLQDEVIIHDLAVNPISQNIYVAASRANAAEVGFWKQPNDITYATVLLKIDPKGLISEVSLDQVSHSKTALAKVIAPGTPNWRKSDKRTEAITDVAYDEGKVYISGLSNEEFASSLRVIPFPFKDGAESFSTVEVWHVAHAKNETEAPIRTLLPYDVAGQKHILATYTCTPFVSIPVSDIKMGQHIKSKTLAEFGSGNMPIDIISYQKKGKDFLLMSSGSKALIRIDPDNLSEQREITEPLEEFQYTVGLAHDVLSGVGVTQIDNYNSEHILVLQRMPNGDLNLQTRPTRWL